MNDTDRIRKNWFVATVRALVVAGVAVLALAAGSGMAVASANDQLTGAQAPTTTVAVAEPPFVDADSAGYPLVACGPGNDGQIVRTRDANGGVDRYICFFNDPIFEDGRWEWKAIVEA